MIQKAILTAAVFASMVLVASAATACPFNAADNASDSNQVASGSSQPTQPTGTN
ncbi:MAG TPA: hypothetical protein VGG27_09090 [Magnetospirillaceae bacterium]|jgi:hypothetical protein